MVTQGEESCGWNSAALDREGLEKQHFSIHLEQAPRESNIDWLEGKPGEIRVRGKLGLGCGNLGFETEGDGLLSVNFHC